MPFLSLNKTQTKNPQETHTLKKPTKTHTQKETKIYKQKNQWDKKISKESNMSQKVYENTIEFALCYELLMGMRPALKCG